MKKLFDGNSWKGNVKNDILSGMTVALALIPEAISFAIIAGLDPMVGLYASFCIAVTIAIFGGRPGMISAATGAMALVMVELVADHGVEFVFLATIVTGILQFILGKLKVGQVVHFIPHSVVLGFVNSLAILIFMTQLPHFVGEQVIMYGFVALTLLIIYGLPRLTKAVPSPLVAIVVITIISVVLKADVRTVGDMGNMSRALPSFHLPLVPLSIESLLIVLPYSVTLAIVGLTESLLTATIVDEMTDTKGDMNQEVVGQGLANIVAGFFGGMAGCAMIGQSVINVKSGGRKRLSTMVAGIFLIFLIVILGDVVAVIPMAALVGVMFMVSFSTFEWDSLLELRKMPLSCSASMIATMAVVIATDNLAMGVAVGITTSAIFFAWKVMHVEVKTHLVNFEASPIKVYRVSGQVYFASISKLIEKIDFAGDKDEDFYEVIIDFKNAHIWDHSAIVGLKKIRERYENNNVRIAFTGINKASGDIAGKLDFEIG